MFGINSFIEWLDYNYSCTKIEQRVVGSLTTYTLTHKSGTFTIAESILVSFGGGYYCIAANSEERQILTDIISETYKL